MDDVRFQAKKQYYFSDFVLQIIIRIQGRLPNEQTWAGKLPQQLLDVFAILYMGNPNLASTL